MTKAKGLHIAVFLAVAGSNICRNSSCPGRWGLNGASRIEVSCGIGMTCSLQEFVRR